MARANALLIVPEDRATVAVGGWDTGHYCAAPPALVMEVAAITQRTNPAISLIVPSVAGGEFAVLRKARERFKCYGERCFAQSCPQCVAAAPMMFFE